MWVCVAFIYLCLISQLLVEALICSRFPANTLMPKSPVDENFAILIKNNPQTYILGQEYNITINAYNGHRYITFTLALENENGYFNLNEDLGQFKISDPVETRFSPNCINMVESTNTHPKIRSEVTWVAPTDPNSGCVLIRATLLQHRDVWHMDDGGLTRRICQEVVDEVENKRAYETQECCACDEARYELTFQGIWNRNLHPKDFPSKGWITRFSDIIGAAHTADYRFWKDGELASDGMKEYAEYGSTRALEKEFNANFQEGVIRTIIKARGPAFPNLNGISVASVRVDPKHHFVSLTSKIDPSPDWFVGVSGLELCMQNCTWLEERVIQLYPWDAGTDAGPSYTSADQPQVPPDVIRRMRSNFPNDPRSPFYDETGAAMAPIATLFVKRQRIYERTCEDEESNNGNIPRECFTHPWTKWSECTAACGVGHSYRTRVYKQAELAKIYKCDEIVALRQDRICKGENCNGPDIELDADIINDETLYSAQRNPPECALTPWSDWSECSNSCGEGTTIRRREFINIRSQEACQSTGSMRLIEVEKCKGVLCLGDLTNSRNSPYSRGTENFDVEEENGLYNHGEQEDFKSNNNNEYWNTANNNYARESSQYGRRAEYWNGNTNNRGNEEEKHELWSNDRRDISQVSRYGNERYNDAVENQAYQTENQDTIEENGNRFEIGNLHRSNMETGNRLNSYKTQQSDRKLTQHYGQQMNDANSELKNEVPTEIPYMAVPSKCFQKLNIFNCWDPTVKGNYWFYNYCEDQCMLFAVDRCDRNVNKFTSLEQCQLSCQRSLNEPYLKYQQARTCTVTENRRSNKRKKNSNWRRY